jgi:hypothetical protein
VQSKARAILSKVARALLCSVEVSFDEVARDTFGNLQMEIEKAVANRTSFFSIKSMFNDEIVFGIKDNIKRSFSSACKTAEIENFQIRNHFATLLLFLSVFAR